MSAENPLPTARRPSELAQLGARVRAARKAQKVSASTTAEAAGISRVTLHRIEHGESSVAIASWFAAGVALGLKLDWVDPTTPAQAALPSTELIALAEYPELKRLAWQLPHVEEVSPQDALALYERNWRHVNTQALSMKEVALINALAMTIGRGAPLV